MLSGMSVSTFLDTSRLISWLRLDRAAGSTPISLSWSPRCRRPWQWNRGRGRSLHKDGLLTNNSMLSISLTHFSLTDSLSH